MGWIEFEEGSFKFLSKELSSKDIEYRGIYGKFCFEEDNFDWHDWEEKEQILRLTWNYC